jgi:hypothetical protein
LLAPVTKTFFVIISFVLNIDSAATFIYIFNGAKRNEMFHIVYACRR